MLLDLNDHITPLCATPCPTCRGERITFKTNTTTNVTTVSGFNDEDTALTPVDAAFVTRDGEQDSVAIGVIRIISAVLFPRRTTLGTLAGSSAPHGLMIYRWQAPKTRQTHMALQ